MSYNGYYISFPRKRRGSDSLHSHQTIIRKSIYTLYFYGRPSEKDREAGLLAPNQKNKNVYVLYFFDCLYEKDYGVTLLALFFEMILHFFNCLYEKDYAVIFLAPVFNFATAKNRLLFDDLARCFRSCPVVFLIDF